MTHVALHDVEAVLPDHGAQFVNALLVGCHLRLHVGKVLVGVARRELAALQQRAHLGFAEGCRPRPA